MNLDNIVKLLDAMTKLVAAIAWPCLVLFVLVRFRSSLETSCQVSVSYLSRYSASKPRSKKHKFKLQRHWRQPPPLNQKPSLLRTQQLAMQECDQ